MAQVKGAFLADFTSFYTAVQKAQVSLGGLEKDSAKVEKALDRTANAFQGSKIIQQASIATEAVNRVGGATALTEKEQAKLNGLVTEAIAKYSALGKSAPAEMTALADATAKVPKQLSLADQGMSILKSSFGQFTLAGIAQQAIGALTQEVGRFVDEGKKLPGLEASFQSLSKAAKVNGDAMLASMGSATKGLVSDFNLLQSANKSMLLGLPVTEQSMGELANAATTLGRAMGQDATKSLDDLIVALGRSSPMILDNLGLTVKVGEANEAYAAKLGKSVDSLTDAEKKMAFYEAAMEAARRKTAELGDQTLTLSEIVTRAWTSIGNVISRSAGTINQGIGAILTKKDQFLAFTKVLLSGGTVGQAVVMAGIGEQAAAQQAANKKDVNLPAPVVAGLTDEQKRAAKKAAADAAREQERIDKDTVARMLKNAELQERTNAELGKSFDALRASVVANRIGPVLMEDFAVVPEITRNSKELKTQTEELTGTLKVWGKITGDQYNAAAAAAHKFFETLPPQIDATKEVATATDKLNVAMLALADTTGSKLVANFATFTNGLATVGSSMDGLKSAFNTAKGGISDFGKGLSTLTSGGGLSSILSGFSGMVSGIGGVVAAAQAAIAIGKQLFGLFQNKGRDAVKDFAGSFGGFDELHAKLLTLGDAGEALWVKLTQGVDKKDAAAAAKVIAEIEAAFDKQKDAADDATAATEDEAKATVESASEAAKALDALAPKIEENKVLWAGWRDSVNACIDSIAANLKSLQLPTLTQSQAGSATKPGGGTVVLELDGKKMGAALLPGIAAGVKSYGLA